MAWLVVHEEGDSPRVLEVAAGPFRIGRRASNDLVLGDFGASRDHCRIERAGDGWRVVDLGAANGTFLNGERLAPRAPTPLAPGDEIRIGRASLRFFAERPGAAALVTGPAAPADATRVLKPDTGRTVVANPDVVRPLDEVALPKSVEYFSVLHELAKQLLGAHDVKGIGRTALKLLFRALPVERAAIALAGADGTFAPLVDRTRKGDDHATVSQTIASWVLRERIAVITSDARHDPRFQRGESVVAYNIRSAMCVPLWSEADTLGVLYLDNLLDAHAFTEAELELVTAVANQVAIGMHTVRLSEQLRDEAVIRANLSGYHSPDVVEMILRRSREGRSIAIEVAEEVVTVLFCDIVGFTSMSERLGPGEVAELLNTFFERMTRAIFDHQGSVNKYIGDAIMAIFGAPIARDNHAELAVRSALRMQAEVAAIQDTVPADRRFRVRIGVNSGRVVVGNIGSSQRMEFTVLGDPVNVAQRLESICEPGMVYVGEETYLKTRDAFHYRDLGEVSLKGKQQQIRVFAVQA
jgi:adenylate cyclase